MTCVPQNGGFWVEKISVDESKSIATLRIHAQQDQIVPLARIGPDQAGFLSYTFNMKTPDGNKRFTNMFKLTHFPDAWRIFDAVVIDDGKSLYLDAIAVSSALTCQIANP
jgi:hypothetical protein